MERKFREIPQALDAAYAVSERCGIDIPMDTLRLPGFGASADEELRDMPEPQ